MTVSQYQLIALDGSALVALDVDGLLAAFVPTASADTVVTGSLLDPHGTGAGELDWARTVTMTLVDADATVTSAKMYLTGTDLGGAVMQETLTLVAAGTTESNNAFASLTAVTYHVDGVVTAVIDTLSLGWGDKLALPETVGALGNIRTKRVDTTIDAGTVDLTYQTWEPTGGNIPDAAKRFYTEIIS